MKMNIWKADIWLPAHHDWWLQILFFFNEEFSKLLYKINDIKTLMFPDKTGMLVLTFNMKKHLTWTVIWKPVSQYNNFNMKVERKDRHCKKKLWRCYHLCKTFSFKFSRLMEQLDIMGRRPGYKVNICWTAIAKIAMKNHLFVDMLVCVQ